MLNQEELIEGKKVVFRLTPDKIRDIKIIGAEKETTLNNLFVEGIDCVLDKYRLIIKVKKLTPCNFYFQNKIVNNLFIFPKTIFNFFYRSHHLILHFFYRSHHLILHSFC